MKAPCVSYQRRKLYIGLTIPFLAILIFVFIFLWTYNPLLSLIFLLMYVLMWYLQAYCCSFQKCPYIGKFCPAIAGIMPASWLAKVLYSGKKTDSKKRFEIHATIAILCWIVLAIFPCFWIMESGFFYIFGYVAFHLIYYMIFAFTFCPYCAIHDTCPGGTLYKKFRKNGFHNSEDTEV